ncbi:MAG: 2-C-methyl-D-erythritol 4-phosphate cytidylyltransferase [Lachnospiraceae bacterium]|nr:2-C-methyl-D-erythritol 4-phosphate cytidylyltransferase [Lachnospiraceae bacterium]MDE7273082.1 2-C-methyl-D-erythritol 4-phosphate cytidylyltransferase [Lachnospiraceae bacterium]
MNVALILSGGTGTRLGSDVPKQYIEVDDRPVISYCIEQFIKHNKIDAIQIVADRQWHRVILKCLEKYGHLPEDCTRKFHGFSEPGENRQLSIYHGMEDIIRYTSDSDVVMIHDAARPMISAQMITDSLNAVEGHDGVLPVLSMKDTVYKSEDGAKISALLDRSKIYAGQAPETFRIGRYYEANRRLLPDRICAVNGSTEPAVMAGMDIIMIPGDEKNFKITTKDDMERFCEMMKRQAV